MSKLWVAACSPPPWFPRSRYWWCSCSWGLLKTKAHIAGLAGLGAAILVAIFAFGMPVQLSLLAASQGAVYGLFPIMWIVVTAIWLYQLTVVSGRFEDLRISFNRVSADPRIQGIIIAFCFGGLLEALAGFGAPVAITGIMLVSLGFSADAGGSHGAAGKHRAGRVRRYRASRSSPPGNLTGIDYQEIGAVVGRQTPLLAAFVPLLLVLVVDGKRGVSRRGPRPSSPASPSPSRSSSVPTYISVELTDIIASLVALVAVVVLLPLLAAEGWRGGQRTTPARLPGRSTPTARPRLRRWRPWRWQQAVSTEKLSHRPHR